jgi:hypothetical protein
MAGVAASGMTQFPTIGEVKAEIAEAQRQYFDERSLHMVAYNFMPWLAPKVQSGEKPHTFRANGKRAHAVKGDGLQLYTGMRTKDCRLLRETVCIGSWQCHLPVSPSEGPTLWSINGKVLTRGQMEDFAINDGFNNFMHMAEWIFDNYGIDATGTLIAWEWRSYLPVDKKEKLV